MTVSSSPAFVVTDANVMIALCAQEADKYSVAKSIIEQYANNGAVFYAPGVIVAETLFALCRRLADGLLTPAEHAQAVQSFRVRMQAVLPPPQGDAILISRAEQIRGAYGCSHSADGITLLWRKSWRNTTQRNW